MTSDQATAFSPSCTLQKSYAAKKASHKLYVLYTSLKSPPVLHVQDFNSEFTNGTSLIVNRSLDSQDNDFFFASVVS